jgi:hypothetical protein
MPKKKKQRFPKVMGHPKKNWVVKMLKGKMGVRKISEALKEMYPDNNNLWLSPGTLQKFRKEHLQVEGEALKYMKDIAREEKLEKDVKKEHNQIRRLPSYKEKIKEAVDLHIDIKEQLTKLSLIIESRVEDLFDKAQRGEATTNQERNLQGYLNTYIATIEKWAKYIDKIADQRIETNINVTVIEDQMSLIREAVREVIMEMDSKLAEKFLENLNKKMKELSYRNKPEKLEKIHSDVKILGAKIINEDGYGD